MRPPLLVSSVRLLGAVLALVLVAGCKSPVGGPVAGPQDGHCDLSDGGHLVTVPIAGLCHPVQGQDGGQQPLRTPETSITGLDYGPPNNNTTADDDDCKYNVGYSVTTVRENTDVSFTVTLTSLAEGTPVTDAGTQVEAFIGNHPARTAKATTVESPPGTYRVGPVQFDASGVWAVRFHFFEDCSDASAESPHGHVAFLLEVP